MRTVEVFPAVKKVRLIDPAEPRIESDTEVLLKTLDVGIGGTDREIARFEYGSPPDGSAHLVIGHESKAQPLEVSRSVRMVEPEGLVVAKVRGPANMTGAWLVSRGNRTPASPGISLSAPSCAP